jgi:aminoglycoside phosphotransferase (APT) family kinase protein
MPNDAHPPLESRLIAYLGGKADGPVTVAGLTRLAGGVSRESWAFDLIGGEDGGRVRQPLVLRMDTAHPFIEGSRVAEAELIRLAGRHGVPVPRVLWSEADPAILGAGFLIMERVPGESRIGPLLADPRFARTRALLPGQMAEALVRIHRITPRSDARDATRLRRLPQREAVAHLETLYRARVTEPHPVLELGLRWLQRHLPPAARLALVHGDFRPGNMLYDETGLRAVLDWELAYFGDPLADVAWVALRSWRGGHDALAVGGLAPREAFHRAYEQAGGRAIEPDLMRFWDVFAAVRWAGVTILELAGFLDGVANIELASLGRRTAEIEWDLLTLLQREEG